MHEQVRRPIQRLIRIKVTPNIALGGNSAMEDVALLTNLLHLSIESHPHGRPNKATLGAAFRKY
jgi:hypothetical protein